MIIIKQNLLFLILFLIILLNILLFIFDFQLTKEFKNYEEKEEINCFLLKNNLAISALSRINTNFCKQFIKSKLCEINDYWKIEKIENNCKEYFDLRQQNTKIGCFYLSSINKLIKNSFNFSLQNSPEFCIQKCLNSGFSFAGVGFGVNCYCFNYLIEKNENFVNENLCNLNVCPGKENEFCDKQTKILPKFIPYNGKSSSNKIKILFLLQLNGRDYLQIRRLLGMIYSQKHFYFVHVDSRQQFLYSGSFFFLILLKFKFSPEMLKIQKEFEIKGFFNFKVLKKRFATIWGGTSLLELFLFVINQSIFELEIEWDYIINLSEKDMPLLSLEELEKQLENSSNKSFLSSHGYNTASFLNKQGFNFHFLECEKRMWRVAKRNDFPLNLRLDGGSDWLIIHRDLAEYSVSNEDLPSNLRLLFTTILLPLESFFHTLSINSKNFCNQIFNQNLRFTNWERKQGCRCSAFKPIVDWCGCSPLAVKNIDVEKKINLKRCQEKNLFFGRKFDSFIDVEPINFLQKQVLRFREKQQYFNFTQSFWLNIFNYETSNDSPFSSKIELINLISKLFIKKINKNNCLFNRLLNIFIFRVNSTAKFQNIFQIEMKCEEGGGGGFEVFEFLIEKITNQQNKKDSQIITEEGIFELIDGIEFGIGFDVKEEIFRIHPPIVDLNLSDLFTLKWKWNLILNKENNNWTSPNVNLILNGPNNELLFNEKIKSYDSLNGIQFVDIKFKNILNENPNVNSGKFLKYLGKRGSEGYPEGKEGDILRLGILRWF
ncbi:unnamed protein product [Meloidogyne enterolobii]|uniref:Uncharacterized protein n=1 Tax=Meloidogyne enterolobii TaxID=390850 RepID=A0ACB0Y1F0_MELEN